MTSVLHAREQLDEQRRLPRVLETHAHSRLSAGIRQRGNEIALGHVHANQHPRLALELFQHLLDHNLLDIERTILDSSCHRG